MSVWSGEIQRIFKIKHKKFQLKLVNEAATSLAKVRNVAYMPYLEFAKFDASDRINGKDSNCFVSEHNHRKSDPNRNLACGRGGRFKHISTTRTVLTWYWYR